MTGATVAPDTTRANGQDGPVAVIETEALTGRALLELSDRLRGMADRGAAASCR